MGMTHVMAFDSYKNSVTKNETISLPVTVFECPAMRIFSVRGYTHDHYGYKVAREIIVAPKDKHMTRKVSAHKASTPSTIDSFSIDNLDDVTVILSTQPSLTGTGQKKPQLFEVELGGKTVAEKFEGAKSLVGKDIKASDLFKAGDYIDFHAITKGYGIQGPVRRFGISFKGHKSEKGVRRPGSIAGGWSAQQHTMYRVAYSGQTGYHQRTQYNNQILKITDNPDDVNPAGGFVHYGVGHKGNEFVLIRGSAPGARNRLVTFVKAIRVKKATTVPTVEHISLQSKQGK